jgi:hypothetical protein
MLGHEGFLFIVSCKFLYFYSKVSTFCIFSQVFEVLPIFVGITQKYAKVTKIAKNSEI